MAAAPTAPTPTASIPELHRRFCAPLLPELLVAELLVAEDPTTGAHMTVGPGA